MSTSPLLPGDVEPLLPRQDSNSTRSPPWLALLTRYQWVVWLGVPVAIGLALGLALGTSMALPSPWNVVSPVIGWTYFAAWSISFYPQVWLNYSRKSVAGLSLDFQLLNLLGFTAYAVYNCALYWSPVVRAQYRASHSGTDPAVHANDVFFSLHAVALTALTLAQCVAYPRGRTPPARWCVLAVAGTTAGVLSYAGLLAVAAPTLHPSCIKDCPVAGPYTWLDLLYAISSVKLAISLVKYIPQLLLNQKLRSTFGWNVWNVLLDFEGGILSLAQMIIDNSVCGDWSAITGNPVKFGLGLTSMFFDVGFVLQHVVFGKNEPPKHHYEFDFAVTPPVLIEGQVNDPVPAHLPSSTPASQV